ncbi:MAG: hypothetical protein ACOYIE_08010 [Agathobaculum sp.]
MFCRGQVLGVVLIVLGSGLLVGGLLPFCLPVWLLALALIAAGVFVFRC